MVGQEFDLIVDVVEKDAGVKLVVSDCGKS